MVPADTRDCVDAGAGAVLADGALGGARRERGGEEEATQGSGAVHGARCAAPLAEELSAASAAEAAALQAEREERVRDAEQMRAGLEAELMVQNRWQRGGLAVATEGNSVLRVYVFTDGEDTDSPGAYRGTNGMNVLQRSLLSRGFRIEWHIDILDFGMNNWTEDTLKQFEALCDATGGSFGLIRGEPDPDNNRGAAVGDGLRLEYSLSSLPLPPRSSAGSPALPPPPPRPPLPPPLPAPPPSFWP